MPFMLFPVRMVQHLDMRLTISNQTEDDILCQFGRRTTDERVLLVPPFSASAQFSPKCTFLLFSKRSLGDACKELPGAAEDPSPASIKLSATPGRKWERVAVQGDFPWIIYRNQISRRQHVLVVFPHRDTSCFLASIPNSVPLSSLMLPGTHETMALYGWPISQCQTQTLDTQFQAGIRVIDIRLSIIDGRLIAYHGVFPEVTPFADVLVTLYDFLTSPATASETVVVSIKQEDTHREFFPKLALEEIVASPGGLEMWFLENRIPCLGEVRGKAVLFRRFGCDIWGNGAIGIHPPFWPDSAKEGFEWECSGTLVRTQDWYSIPSFLSIPEKAARSTDILLPAECPIPSLSISFMSASSIPLALPPIVACGFGWPKWGLGFEGVNSRVGKWLLDQLSSDEAKCQFGSPDELTVPKADSFASADGAGPRIRGWALMDYYADPTDAEVVRLFVECNFRGRRAGEEGW